MAVNKTKKISTIIAVTTVILCSLGSIAIIPKDSIVENNNLVIRFWIKPSIKLPLSDVTFKEMPLYLRHDNIRLNALGLFRIQSGLYYNQKVGKKFYRYTHSKYNIQYFEYENVGYIININLDKQQ